MNEIEALTLADQTIQRLRLHNTERAVWLVRGKSIETTPTNYYGEIGWELVGVFGPQIGRADLRDAIVETWRSK